MPETKPCRSCKAPVVFAEHERTHRLAPLERSERGTFRVWPGEGGRYLYALASPRDPAGPRYVNHYATCPNAKQWRDRIRRGGGVRA